MNLKSLNIFLSLMLLLLAAGCRDDLIYGPEIGEGEANVKFSMEFEKMFVGLDNNTRAPGNAVNTINNITVVAFDGKGDFYKAWRSTGKSGDFTYDLNENTGMPGDYTPNPDLDNGEHQAEAKTPKADFTLGKIPYGRYSFYAIANLDVDDSELSSAQDMKDILVEWKDSIPGNNAMFGFFSTDDKAGVRPQSFDAPQVVLNKSEISLWAWLKRTVSKVTVAFDGSKLNQNVTIYLKDVQIRDIPGKCYLGKDNKPSSMSDLITNGETITYQEGSAYGDTWKAVVTKGDPVYGAKGRYNGEKALTLRQQIEWQHSEDAPALYFFENMQGQGIAGTASDKRQDVNKDGNNKNDQISYPNGNNPSNEGFKDAKRYGSYIEVHAYYVNTSSENTSSGDIIYRFMLGQDDWLDYDALRNRHYKLTMSFNGNANDVDWHIVYTQPEVSFPRPYYISYLYNHKMYCPVTINTGRRTLDSVSTRILSNNWGPTDPGNYIYLSEMNVPYEYQYNGFLSLRQTKTTVVTASAPWEIDKNKDYYAKNARGWRVYRDMTDGGHYDKDYTDNMGQNDLSTDLYYVKHEVDKDGNNIYNISLPMYTRAKQLIKQTGYTGNNPYGAYMRDAKVQIQAHLSDGSTIAPDSAIDIRQVRRVVNPKGIFRDWNSTRSFHVELKRLMTENSSTFEKFTSQGGPWKAYVIRVSGNHSGQDDDGAINPSDAETTEDAAGMISFSGGKKVWKSNNKNVSDTVYGDTGSFIDFNILFNNHCTSSSKSRHAVIRVEYHNNSCYHLIYVRQGGAPVRLVNNGAKWHSANMVSRGQEGSSPIDEGSLFKFGRWDYPIASSCNVNSIDPWINIVPNSFTDNNGLKLTIEGMSNTASWSDWSGNRTNNNAYFGAPTVSGARVASYEDFYALYSSDDIEQGYGVLYGDAATGTGTTLEEVYGYHTGKSTSYGIRGCFVYDKTNGVHVFFPMGNSGYGHRKNSGTTWPIPTGSNARATGVLRYSCNGRWGYFPTSGIPKVYPEGARDCPLFYDIFMRPGAIYWLGQVKESTGNDFSQDPDVSSNIAAWDFNYFSFDFYPISGGNVGHGADACFVRCVED